MFSRLEHALAESYVFLDNRNIFILANISIINEPQLCEQISWLQKHSIFYCGISYPFSDIMTLPTAAEQCSLALTFASGGQSGIYFCRDYALNYMKDTLRACLNSSAIHPALEILLANDQVNHDELYSTLYIYLTHNCNMAQSARILNLHRNSMLYRLNKIKDLTGINLEDSDVRQYLYLSYLQKGNVFSS